MISREAIDRIVELGEIPQVDANGDREFLPLPAGFTIHDVSKHFPPKVTAAHIITETPESFVDYVNRFKRVNTILLATVTDGGAKIIAIIDYHAPDAAARCLHWAEFSTVPTIEWKTWAEHNGQHMSQLEFATFLEDNLALFNNPDAKPTGAELLELVLSLEGKNHVNFTSAHRLDSGKNSLVFTEDVTLKGTTQPTQTTGEMELPKELIAGIAPFQGATPYAVKARLKYRINSRHLELWYETIAPHIIIRDSVKSVVKLIETGTALKPIQGKKN